jgi:hypothetical protein
MKRTTTKSAKTSGGTGAPKKKARRAQSSLPRHVEDEGLNIEYHDSTGMNYTISPRSKK